VETVALPAPQALSSHADLAFRLMVLSPYDMQGTASTLVQVVEGPAMIVHNVVSHLNRSSKLILKPPSKRCLGSSHHPRQRLWSKPL
jgi:hypothetical protein